MTFLENFYLKKKKKNFRNRTLKLFTRQSGTNSEESEVITMRKASPDDEKEEERER